MDIHDRIASRVRELRDAQGFSLEALAARSGVSRSNISLIERGESSPTAAVLDRLAGALGVTLASLFEPAGPAPQPSPLARAADQPEWKDPSSGYLRRNLSPPVPSPLQLVEVRFPAGQRVTLDANTRELDTHQQVWVIEGAMEVGVGAQRWRLEAGDCLAMRLDQPITYRNPTRRAARYLVALASPALLHARRTA